MPHVSSHCGVAVMLYIQINGLNKLNKNNYWSLTRSTGSLAADGVALSKRSSDTDSTTSLLNEKNVKNLKDLPNPGLNTEAFPGKEIAHHRSHGGVTHISKTSSTRPRRLIQDPASLEDYDAKYMVFMKITAEELRWMERKVYTQYSIYFSLSLSLSLSLSYFQAEESDTLNYCRLKNKSGAPQRGRDRCILIVAVSTMLILSYI